MAVKITVSNNGPLRLEWEAGDLTICDAQSSPYGLGERVAISLCRCGLSANKPLCDGSHRQGFESLCEAREVPPPKPKV